MVKAERLTKLVKQEQNQNRSPGVHPDDFSDPELLEEYIRALHKSYKASKFVYKYSNLLLDYYISWDFLFDRCEAGWISRPMGLTAQIMFASSVVKYFSFLKLNVQIMEESSNFYMQIASLNIVLQLWAWCTIGFGPGSRVKMFFLDSTMVELVNSFK